MHRLRLVALLLLAASSALALPPTVRKLEPPNWWIGLRDPMLLITGENLTQATVRTSYPGVGVARSEPSADGRYLFVWLKIRNTTRPGTVALNIRTSEGSARAELPLARRRSTADAGVFQGLNTGDVIYLIMPDRFADGDPTNRSEERRVGKECRL